MRGLVRSLCVPAVCLLFAGAADAAWPERSVQIIVGVSPGGGTDQLARLVGQKLGEKWGQPVVVVNRPGADFRIAAEFVANSKPDGYTLFMIVTDLALPNPPGVTVTYDLVKSFIPVVELTTAPYCLAVGKSSPANSVKDVLAMAKAQPSKVNFGVVGTGGPAELGWRRLLALTGTQTQFIHYQGSSPVVTALLGGETSIASVPCLNVLSHLQAGELRVLAITDKVDVPELKSVPTFEEATGIKGYDGGGANWYGLEVPTGTPTAVVAKIREDSIAVMGNPDVQKYLRSQVVFPAVDHSQADFDKLIRNEIVRWDAWSKETESMNKPAGLAK